MNEAIRTLLLFVAALGFTVAAYAYPKNGLFPTLAFFTWALLFVRAIVEAARETGVLPVELPDEELPEEHETARE